MLNASFFIATKQLFYLFHKFMKKPNDELFRRIERSAVSLCHGTANPIQFITNYSQWFVMSFKTLTKRPQNDKFKLNPCF
ncbi:hypothetical protein CN11_06945 [Haemophilus influenzae]|nr:hypothetical protein CK45_04190 [Haemophilus influenzae]KAI99748.1 hypothetical protein CN10_03040 [Haemophilus influenzae]KAJ00071.1 hypothetical protein CN11_06945 [Haemophilus influenzae]RFN75674.1 hypothetical protein CH633_00485 [Haemophilus influenzae]RFN95987.1 hypothetical protein CH636_01940 [Haemophilus influenzae]